MSIQTEDANLLELKQVLRDTMHEVREFNRVIKANSEMLTRLLQIDNEGSALTLNVQNANNARGQALAILQTAQMVSARLDLIDFETNPEVFSSERKITGSVYGKFDKARKMLFSRARHKDVHISLCGKSRKKSEIYPVFDILPFLLVENAVKYAPSNSEIAITVDEYQRTIEVKIESMGPLVENDELLKIDTKCFRSSEAKKTGEKGSGFGLYFAKFVADLHDANLQFTSAKEAVSINGVRYSTFSVTLTFPA
jgi:light-regulated signal transduction histidine kinase (bacteriophytochrome)